ncbi:hypothetical protein SAMN05414139_05948 [Burkholderia sp. D7]|nr:hypothetical protein SAMN05414139_05948 [Burkholderia sp. D7]
MPNRTPKAAGFAEVLFGGLAKGTMVVVGVAAVVLGVLGGGLTDLPTTRKEWGYLLLVILVAIIGFVSFIGLKHLLK